MRKKTGIRKRRRAARRNPARSRARRRDLGAREQLAVLGKLRQDPAAWALGVTSRTLRDAVDAPRLPDGTYNLQLLLAWWMEREKRKIGSGPSAAMERLREAKAASAERRNAIETGRLVDAEDAAHTARWIFGAIASHLQGFSRLLPPTLAAELNATIERMRAQLYASFPQRAPAPAPPPAPQQVQGPEQGQLPEAPDAAAS